MAPVGVESEDENSPKYTDFSGRILVILAVVVAAVVVASSTAFTELGSGVIAGATVVYAGLTYFLVKHTKEQAKTSAAGLEAQRVALERQYEAVRAQIDAAAQQVEEAAKSNTVAAQMHDEAIKGRLDPFAPRVTVRLVQLAPEVVQVRHHNQPTDERPTTVIMEAQPEWKFHVRWTVRITNHGDMPVRVWLSNVYVQEDESGHRYLAPGESRDYPLDHRRIAYPIPTGKEEQRQLKFVAQFTDVQDNIRDTHTLEFRDPMFREDGNVLRVDWGAKANAVPLARISRDYVYVRRTERKRQQAGESSESPI